MRVDRIIKHERDEILTEKSIPVGEEYFIDHFPDFSVVPGVLMLEYLIDTAGWHIREREAFARSQVFLTAVSHVKFSRIVRPPVKLELHCRISGAALAARDASTEYEYQGRVLVEGRPVVTARFRLKSQSLAQAEPRFAHLEEKISDKSQNEFRDLVRAGAQGGPVSLGPAPP